MGIPADVGLAETDAGELARPLLEVRHERRGGVGADDDRVEHVVRLLPLPDFPEDRAERNVRDARERRELAAADRVRPSAAPRDRGRRPSRLRSSRARCRSGRRQRRAARARGSRASVRGRARRVLRAGENLQRPEPHHERREADEEERAEDREPSRELRRDAIRLDGGLALGLRPPCPCACPEPALRSC